MIFLTLKSKFYYLVARGTAFFGIDMKYFVSGGFWTALGQGVNSILSLTLIIAFANLLPKETYGLYRYILSIAGLLNIFTLTGMNAAVAQSVAAGNEGALKSSVKYQLKWNLMMMAAMFGLSGYYYLNENSTLAISMFVLGIFSPFIAALNTYGGYLSGRKQFKLNNIFSIFSTALYAASILIAILISREVIGLIIAYALSTFAANLFFYFKTVKMFGPAETSSGDAIAYGRKLTFINFIGPVVGQIDNIVLTHFWGPVQLAVYSLARAMPDRIVPFIKDMVNLGMPKLAAKSAEDINKVFYRRLFQGMAMGIILSAGYIILAPLVFKYLLPKYLESVFYSQILSLMFIFSAPLGYLGTAFYSQKLVHSIFLSNFSMSVIKIALYIILGIWGGILGLVLAQVIYSAFGFIFNAALWKFKNSAT